MMTFAEYMAKVEGYQIMEQKQWEHTRFISMFVLNGYAKKPIRDPKKLMELPLVDKKEKNTLTVEQMRQIVQLAKMGAA